MFEIIYYLFVIYLFSVVSIIASRVSISIQVSVLYLYIIFIYVS